MERYCQSVWNVGRVLSVEPSGASIGVNFTKSKWYINVHFSIVSKHFF